MTARSCQAGNWSCHLPTNSPADLAKRSLRKKLRAKCLAMTAEARAQAAQAAAQIWQENPLFSAHSRFACYFAHGGEFDVMPIIKKIWTAGKKCYLPVLAETGVGTLQFMQYEKNDPLQTNRYNILEPLPDAGKEMAAEKLDVVLVPLTGFDKHGFRLGSGGGFYDKTFGFLLREPRAKKPLLIGVGFQEQEVALLPHDAWDVRLDGMLTEKALVLY